MSAASTDGFGDANGAERVRVAVVAPALLQRQALQQLVRRSSSLQLVATAARPAQLDPQVAIDVLLASPGQPPDEALIDAVLATEQPLVVLLKHPPAHLVEALARSGASVLPERITPAALSAALHCAAAGLVALAPAHIGSMHPGGASLAFEPLTARECEVLSLLVEGLPNRGIGRALSISTHTAKYHVAQILAKLQAASRAQAVAIALREGIVDAAAAGSEASDSKPP
jgi:DNA-binding NarL/FixJ family response regulator